MRTKTLKTLVTLVILLSAKFSYSQKKQETQPQLVLPESYYKGQEEKRKFVEAEKASKTMTLSTSYPQTAKKTGTHTDPETRAKQLLNTSAIPSDFPSYNSFNMTEKDYEAIVYRWFKANPSYRKNNK